MQTSVLQWGNWGSEMSLSRLAQGHTTSRSQAGSSSRPRLCAARLPLPAAPQMESSSLGDGATGTAVHRQLGRALRYSGGLTLSIACPPPRLSPLPDRESTQRVSKECRGLQEERVSKDYRRDVFCETPGRAAGPLAAEGGGVQAGEDGLTLLLLQPLPNNGAGEWSDKDTGQLQR